MISVLDRQNPRSRARFAFGLPSQCRRMALRTFLIRFFRNVPVVMGGFLVLWLAIFTVVNGGPSVTVFVLAALSAFVSEVFVFNLGLFVELYSMLSPGSVRITGAAFHTVVHGVIPFETIRRCRLEYSTPEIKVLAMNLEDTQGKERTIYVPEHVPIAALLRHLRRQGLRVDLDPTVIDE